MESCDLSPGLLQLWALQKSLNQSRCCLGCGLWRAQGSMHYVGCTLAPPGEYHWTVHVWRRCGLFVKMLWPLVIIITFLFFVTYVVSDGCVYVNLTAFSVSRCSCWDDNTAAVWCFVSMCRWEVLWIRRRRCTATRCQWMNSRDCSWHRWVHPLPCRHTWDGVGSLVLPCDLSELACGTWRLPRLACDSTLSYVFIGLWYHVVYLGWLVIPWGWLVVPWSLRANLGWWLE